MTRSAARPVATRSSAARAMTRSSAAPATDTIHGRSGADTLTGGKDADTFVFDRALGPNNVDTISDFAPGIDKIQLDDAIFTAIGAVGALAAGAFALGTVALEADDRILYDAGDRRPCL